MFPQKFSKFMMCIGGQIEPGPTYSNVQCHEISSYRAHVLRPNIVVGDQKTSGILEDVLKNALISILVLLSLNSLGILRIRNM